MLLKNNIIWVTASHFIDVDRLIVPYIANFFNIHWIILGTEKRVPKIFTELIREVKKEKIVIEYYSITSKWYLPTSYISNVKFFKYIMSIKANIIYIDRTIQFWAYYAALNTLRKDNVIFATHNVKTPKGARLEKFARYYMIHVLKKYMNFHVFSKNQREYLETLVKGKNVLYAPLTLKDYGVKSERTDKTRKVRFLSFGHIRRYKRIDLLIEAAQLLYEETKIDFIVTVAGNCPEWKNYQKMIKYKELFDLQIGFVNDHEIPSLFSNANYLVLPYQDLAQSGAITVAFNYNVPVITSDIPQFQEFVKGGQNGYMFKSENVQALKEVMKKCITMDQNHYDQLVASTTNFVKENYSLESIGKKYIEYFNKL